MKRKKLGIFSVLLALVIALTSFMSFGAGAADISSSAKNMFKSAINWYSHTPKELSGERYSSDRDLYFRLALPKNGEFMFFSGSYSTKP